MSAFAGMAKYNIDRMIAALTLITDISIKRKCYFDYAFLFFP